MVNFTMLVGLPGSGKSTWAKCLEDNEIVVSSDAIRMELFGSEEVQTDPAQVFNLMLSRTREALLNGISVIYDATNISAKVRRNTLSKLKDIECYKIAVVMATPYAMCQARNAKRARHVPAGVIERMYKCFQIPNLCEGWDDIDWCYADGAEIFHIEKYYASLPNLTHENPHHALDVKEHMEACYEYFKKTYPLEAHISWLSAAVRYHDIGKWFCKTYVNSKGETTPVAHFYNHENTGAYDSMFIQFKTDDDCLVTDLIAWHMRAHEWDKNPKLKEKEAKLLKPDFLRALEILHDCDINND